MRLGNAFEQVLVSRQDAKDNKDGWDDVAHNHVIGAKGRDKRAHDQRVDHPLAHRQSIRIENLKGHPIVDATRGASVSICNSYSAKWAPDVTDRDKPNPPARKSQSVTTTRQKPSLVLQI